MIINNMCVAYHNYVFFSENIFSEGLEEIDSISIAWWCPSGDNLLVTWFDR